jgi:Mn-dependent DtxR family transcriptional regulator
MQTYSAALCANFNDLKEMNGVTLDSFATRVFSYVRFRAQTTGNTLTTTIYALCKQLHCSLSSLTNTFKKLTHLGVITISITTNQKGYKRTSIKVISDESPFFDYEKIALLRSYTGNDELSLLYSFVAFKIGAYDKLNQPQWVKEIDGKVWWKIDVKRISEQFSISGPTASRRISKLCKLGLLERQRIGGIWYCSIHQETYKNISTEHEEILLNKRPKFDFDVSPSITKQLSSINNTSTGDKDIYINNNTRDSDINLNSLDEIGKELSKRQVAYLLAAIKTTAKKIKFDVLEIFGWIKFSILNPCQRKGTTNFKHAVNRFIKLLRERKLSMPFGYNKYTEEGAQFWQGVLQREQEEKKPLFSHDDTLTPAALAERAAAENVENETWRDILEADNEQIDRPIDAEGERVVLGELSNKEAVAIEGAEERDKRLLNEKAERFAKALATKSKDELANAKILEGLQFELERCIRQGADVDAIHNILANS